MGQLSSGTPESSIAVHHIIGPSKSFISGNYLGAGSFMSGCTEEGYLEIIAHLKECLANARPDGDPHWGNKGIRVWNWKHEGQMVIGKDTLAVDLTPCDEKPLMFHTLESFEQKLAELGA
jgi:hypothetical protein